MDTGSIMADRKSDQIDASEYLHEQKYNELNEKITNYIVKQGYDWTFKEICTQYRKQKQGNYISFTANDVVTKFKSDLELLL